MNVQRNQEIRKSGGRIQKQQFGINEGQRGYQSQRKMERARNNDGSRKNQVNQLQLKYHSQQERVGKEAAATERVIEPHMSERDGVSQHLYSGCRLPSRQQQPQSASQKPLNGNSAARLAQNVQLKFEKQKNLIEIVDKGNQLKKNENIFTQRGAQISQNNQLQKRDSLMRKQKPKGVSTHRNMINEDQKDLRGQGTSQHDRQQIMTEFSSNQVPQESEIQAKEVVPMQLRTQLKRNLMQPSSQKQITQPNNTGQLPAQSKHMNMEIIISPSKTKQTQLNQNYYQYTDDYNAAAGPILVQSINSTRIKSRQSSVKKNIGDEEPPQVTNRFANIYENRRGSQDDFRDGQSMSSHLSSARKQQNSTRGADVNKRPESMSRRQKPKSKRMLHKKAPSDVQAHIWSGSMTEMENINNINSSRQAVQQVQKGQKYQITKNEESSRFKNGGDDEANNYYFRDQTSSRTRMAALALNPKLQNKNRIRTDSRQKFVHSNQEQSARLEPQRQNKIEPIRHIIQTDFDDQVQVCETDEIFRSSTSRPKIAKDSQIKIIPVLRDLDAIKGKQSDLQGLNSAEKRQQIKQPDSNGHNMQLNQISSRYRGHEKQRPQDDQNSQRIQNNSTSNKMQMMVPKTKEKLNMIHNESKGPAKKHRYMQTNAEFQESDDLSLIKEEGRQIGLPMQLNDMDPSQIQEDMFGGYEPCFNQYPYGKSSTQPMIINKVENKYVGQGQATNANQWKMQNQQSMERRRLIFQRQKVFNLSSKEDLTAESNSDIRQNVDSGEPVSKFNQNPLMKSNSKETSVSSIERGSSVNKFKSSKRKTHQKPIVLSSSRLKSQNNHNVFNGDENQRNKNGAQNLYGIPNEHFSSNEDSQMPSYQATGRMEPQKQDMNSTIHQIIKKQQEQINKKNIGDNKIVSKVEVAKAKQGLTEVVFKNSKISSGQGMVQPYQQESPRKQQVSNVQVRAIKTKLKAQEQENNQQRPIDSRRIIEQRGPFPSSQMQPQIDRDPTKMEQKLLNLQMMNAPTAKLKKRQSHNAGDLRNSNWISNGKNTGDDAQLNDLIVSIKNQQKKRSIKPQSQINDVAPISTFVQPTFNNGRRYDTQAALDPSGVLILNSCQHRDQQQKIPINYKSAVFNRKSTSERENSEGQLMGLRSSTKIKAKDIMHIKNMKSINNLNCNSIVQTEQTARAASNFTHVTHDDPKSIKSLQSLKHYGLQNLPHQNGANNINTKNFASSSSEHHLKAPSIIQAQRPINRFRSQPGSKFVVNEDAKQIETAQLMHHYQDLNAQSQRTSGGSKYQNIQVQLSNQYLKLRSFQQQQESEDMRLLKETDGNQQHRTSYGFNQNQMPTKNQKKHAHKQGLYPPEQTIASGQGRNANGTLQKNVQLRTTRHLPHIQTQGSNIDMRKLQLSNLNHQCTKADGQINLNLPNNVYVLHSERQKQSKSQRSIEQIETHIIMQGHNSNEKLKVKENQAELLHLRNKVVNINEPKRDKKVVQSHELLRIKKDLIKSQKQTETTAFVPTQGDVEQRQVSNFQNAAQLKGGSQVFTEVNQVQQLNNNSKRNRSNEQGSSGKSALAFISSRNPVNLRYGVDSTAGIKTERQMNKALHEGTKLDDILDERQLPQELKAAGSHRASQRTGQKLIPIDKKKDRCAVIERLLINENDRILETNENNSHLSSHKQIMKSDDSVCFIQQQKAEVNIKKQLQPKQSDRANGLEKSRSSRNQSHSHGTFRQKDQSSPDAKESKPLNLHQNHVDYSEKLVKENENVPQINSIGSGGQRNSHRRGNSKFMSLSSSSTKNNIQRKQKHFVTSKNIQINNFNLNQESKSDRKQQPKKVREKFALRKHSPEKADKQSKHDAQEELKPTRQQISEIPVNNSSSQQEMLNFIDYLDDRFQLFSETSKLNSGARCTSSKLEDSVAQIQKIESASSRRRLQKQELINTKPQLCQNPKNEKFKGLKLKSELQTPNLNNKISQKSLNCLDPEEPVSPVKVPTNGEEEIDGPLEQQTELELLCGFENSIKFIDQQNSLTRSQQQALALFEQEQNPPTPVRQRRTPDQNAARDQQLTQSDNNSVSSMQMLMKLQQRGNDKQRSSSPLKKQQFSEQKHRVNPNQQLLTRQASDLIEAEQQQDISPLKISVDGNDVINEWQPAAPESPRLPSNHPSRPRTGSLLINERANVPEQKQDDDEPNNGVRPFDADVTIYSFQ